MIKNYILLIIIFILFNYNSKKIFSYKLDFNNNFINQCNIKIYNYIDKFKKKTYNIKYNFFDNNNVYKVTSPKKYKNITLYQSKNSFKIYFPNLNIIKEFSTDNINEKIFNSNIFYNDLLNIKIENYNIKKNGNRNILLENCDIFEFLPKIENKKLNIDKIVIYYSKTKKMIFRKDIYRDNFIYYWKVLEYGIIKNIFVSTKILIEKKSIKNPINYYNQTVVFIN